MFKCRFLIADFVAGLSVAFILLPVGAGRKLTNHTG